MGKGYFAGIDSGSTSTDVVILDRDKKIVSSVIMPTGAGAANGAERALEEALRQSNLNREDICHFPCLLCFHVFTILLKN